MERGTWISDVAVRASRPFVPVYVDIADDDVLARTEARLAEPLVVLPVMVLMDVRDGRRVIVSGAKTADEVADALGDFVSVR